MHLRLLFSLLPFLFFFTEGNPGGKEGDPPEKKDPPEPKSDEVTFDEKQQEKINALLAAERKSAEERTAERLKTEAEDARKKQETEAQRKKDEEAGEFEKVKTSLTDERDTAQQRATDLETQNAELLKLVQADVGAVWKDIPAEVKELYEGDDGDVLAKKRHLTRSAKLIERLSDPKQTLRGSGPNPPARGKTFNEDEEVRKARARTRVM